MTTAIKKKILTQAVKDLQPGQILWDTELKGFAVRCQKESKSYVVKYRFQGKQRWYTIGKHGSPWTAKSAREEALKVLSEVKTGNDSAAIRNNYKNVPLLKEVASG